MNRSVLLFKIKRGFENSCDFLEDLLFSIVNSLKKIVYHPRTEQAAIKIKGVKNKVLQKHSNKQP
jgi:hypothetical protein